jgi:hypothetical protein
MTAIFTAAPFSLIVSRYSSFVNRQYLWNDAAGSAC